MGTLLCALYRTEDSGCPLVPLWLTCLIVTAVIHARLTEFTLAHGKTWPRSYLPVHSEERVIARSIWQPNRN